MNKTVTSNISGIVFHIEEDAYDVLNNYLNAIKTYFKNTASSQEIMTDIEYRIAELFQEKLGKSRQVVVLQDVKQIMEVMGKPEDFYDESATEKNNDQQEYERPKAESLHFSRKRVFRDPDNRVFGGVCSGVSAYFGIKDPVWLRLAFVLFFFGFGSGLFIYIILWLIIPKAQTASEKLEMRGEPVNIDSIEKLIKEETAHLKETFHNIGEELKGQDVKEFRGAIGKSTHRFFTFFVNLFKYSFKFLGSIIAIFLIITSLVILSFLLLILWSKFNFYTSINDSFAYSVISVKDFIGQDSALLIIGLTLFLGIPLVSIIYSCFKFLFNIKRKDRFVRYTSLFAWFVGLGLCIYGGIKTATKYREEATHTKNVAIVANYNMLNIKLDGNYKKPFFVDEEDEDLNFFLPFTVKLDIVKSRNDSCYLSILQSARGKSEKQAQMHAQEISYSFSQTDSTVILQSHLKLEEKQWKNQYVKIILYLPVNKKVYLDESLKYVLHDVDNTSNIYDRDMVAKTWVMTNEGLALY